VSRGSCDVLGRLRQAQIVTIPAPVRILNSGSRGSRYFGEAIDPYSNSRNTIHEAAKASFDQLRRSIESDHSPIA